MIKYFPLAILFVAMSFICSTDPVHNGYHIGDVAADFNLKSTSGNFVSLSDYEDAKGHIVVFTCNHCPYAVLYEDRLIDLHNEYAPKGYHVVAINPNDPVVVPEDDFKGMIAKSAEKAFPFTYLFDEKQEVYPQFGATKTPHVYLLDNDMKVRYIGAIDDSPKSPEDVEETYLADAIDALIAGNEPEPTNTKAIGCSIKVQK